MYNFFENAPSHPLSDVFFDADYDELNKIYKFSKNDIPAHICGKKITWEVQKSKCENLIKCGPKRCEMMREFQSWHQNSNRLTFDPLFLQKLSKYAKSGILPIFDSFFGQKRGQMLIDLNFEVKFGNLSSFRISQEPI